MVTYSIHARTRMHERSISELDVEQTLAHPLEIRSVRYARKAACKHVQDDSYLVVIFEETAKQGLIVVTALKVNRERLGRFGFTRV